MPSPPPCASKTIPSMLWVTASILLLFALLLWLPLELEIDTVHAMYTVRWRGIFGIRGVRGEEHWRWFFTLFFWEKEWRRGPRKPKLAKPKAKKTKPPISARRAWTLAKNLFHAIKTKRFRVDLDTGDFVSNAQLYPLFHAFSNRKRQLAINFNGKEELEILLQTRLWNLTGAVLRSFVQPK